jgi:hypothetical protein
MATEADEHIKRMPAVDNEYESGYRWLHETCHGESGYRWLHECGSRRDINQKRMPAVTHKHKADEHNYTCYTNMKAGTAGYMNVDPGVTST